MKKIVLSVLLGMLATAASAKTVQAASRQTEQANIVLVQKAMDSMFNKHDVQSLPKYIAKNYKQHNPMVDNGREALATLIQSLPASLKYEEGFVAARGDIVMIYGRSSDGQNPPELAADIFRVKNGKIVEHWDVLQNEVPQSQTKSGNSMFVR